MATIDANGTSLYDEEHGSGVPVLCVHGTGSSALAWADAAVRLRAVDAAPAVVIGCSCGGEIGVRCHPGLVRALILLQPAIRTLSTEAHAWADALLAGVRAADVPALSEYGPSTPDAPALADATPGTGHA